MPKKDVAAPYGADASDTPAPAELEQDRFVAPADLDREFVAPEPMAPSQESETEPEAMPGPAHVRLAPEEWRETLFAITGELPSADLWKHGAASALHNWGGHAHHQGKPLLLEREAYIAALDAASSTDEKGNYAPHQAALGTSGKV